MKHGIRSGILGILILLQASVSPAFARVGVDRQAGSSGAIRVAKLFPPDMAADVAVNTPLTVEFGGPVTPSFYESIQFHLFLGTTPIPGELFYNPSAKQVMFKAKTTLPHGKSLTARISYYDGLGNTNERVWTFQATGNPSPLDSQTASARPNQNSPSMSANQPSESQLKIVGASMGGGTVQNSDSLRISFSDALDLASLREAPVKLLVGNQVLGVDYRLSRDMKTLTLAPREPMAAGSEYRITLSRGLASVDGNRLGKKTLIPFSVGGEFEAPSIEVDQHIIDEAPSPRRSENRQPVRRASPPNRTNQNRKFNNPFETGTKPVQAAVMSAAAPASRPNFQGKPLVLTGLSPTNGARVTNLQQPVTIAFNQAIRPETLNEFTFRLEDDFGPVPARIRYLSNRNQAQLVPIGMLDTGRSYRVVVTKGITDPKGNPIRSSISSSFMTTSPAMAPATPDLGAMTAEAHRRAQQQARQQEPAEESLALENMSNDDYMVEPAQTRSVRRTAQRAPAATPRSMPPRARTRRVPQQQLSAFRVDGIVPGSNDNSVSRGAKIAVSFTENADQSTVNNINISVFGNQERVEGSVGYNREKQQAIFSPASPLDSNTKYKVIVSDKVRSARGEPLAKHFSWEFRTNKQRRRSFKSQSTEADAAFYIPLVDSRLPAQRPVAKRTHKKITTKTANESNSAFTFVPSNGWAFKSLRRITQKGMLSSFPFQFTSKVTRYEFANAINSALKNLKAMQNSPDRPRLKIADLVELEHLIIEFRSELRSYGVNPAWLERFLAQQGVNLQEIKYRVELLNRKSTG